MNPVVIAYTSSIAISLFAAVMILATGLKQQKRQYIAMFGLCLVSSAYQFCTLMLHQSQGLEEALHWQTWQTGFALLILPTFYSTYAIWAGLAKTRVSTFLLGLVAIILLVLNFVSEYSLRFKALQELVFVEVLGGHTISLLRGEPSALATVAHLLAITVMVGLVWAAARLYRKGAVAVSLTLLFALTLNLFAAITGMRIDNGSLNWFYMAGFPFSVLFVLVSIHIAVALQVQTRRLARQSAETQALENALSRLAEGVAKSDPEAFFQRMLANLHAISAVDMVFIGMQDSNTQKLETLSVLKQGQAHSNFTYELKGTPCANVIDDHVCLPRQCQPAIPGRPDVV